MNNPVRALLIAMSFASSCCVAAESPTHLIGYINAKGASAVVDEIFSDSSRWEQLMSAIGSAEPGWLSVAALIKPGTDGASAEALTLAAGYALDRKPVTTLAALWPTFGLGMCGFPPDERYDTTDQALSALERRIKSVRAVKSIELFQAKEACLAELERARVLQKSIYEGE